MKIEHTAYQVGDAVAVARWYADHLGMTIKRSMNTSPFAHFLADTGDTVMVEFYSNPAIDTPNYYELHQLIFHLAFWADDVAATRERLIAAGAKPEGEISATVMGDEACFLRDPWGLPLQLVNRKSPMI
jgi:catechol 2,3-dioxygenase-like lactoylglutathione lyase family enzyme